MKLCETMGQKIVITRALNLFLKVGEKNDHNTLK